MKKSNGVYLKRSRKNPFSGGLFMSLFNIINGMPIKIKAYIARIPIPARKLIIFPPYLDNKSYRSVCNKEVPI